MKPIAVMSISPFRRHPEQGYATVALVSHGMTNPPTEFHPEERAEVAPAPFFTLSGAPS
jgi:hypothetical protein